MKRILCYFLFFCVCIYMQAQTYDQLAARAVESSAKREISLELSEKLFEEALKLEPANMRNSMLFSNLGTVQHRLGKIDKAIESYTLGALILSCLIPLLFY